MEIPPPPSKAMRSGTAGEPFKSYQNYRNNLKASSDAVLLPLPLYITNGIFFTLFFSAAYFLLHRWREKIRTSAHLHLLSLSEIAAIVSLIASVIYLLGFFGIGFLLSIIPRASHDHDDVWDVDNNAKKDSRTPGPACPAAIDYSLVPPKVVVPCNNGTASANAEEDDDEEIIKSVVSGSTPSYSLEVKLGDCRRAAAIRREALQRSSGRSLEGLPLEGFDYDSILGQCCEMPVGYVQIPVGIAGPLLLDGKEYTVPMATTEGCLVASTNRGCKAIYSSGGAATVLLRDGMTRAPVVRFGSASRAAQLKFFLEDPLNFESLSLVFNRYVTAASLARLLLVCVLICFSTYCL
jgi:hydroxymethylglutaryl-CoA reductase (NADPH)